MISFDLFNELYISIAAINFSSNCVVCVLWTDRHFATPQYTMRSHLCVNYNTLDVCGYAVWVGVFKNGGHVRQKGRLNQTMNKSHKNACLSIEIMSLYFNIRIFDIRHIERQWVCLWGGQTR